MMVYIVVLNWNGWKDTVACLESLVKLDYCEFKIVVCDNASSNGSVEKINEWYFSNKDNFEYLKSCDYKILSKEDKYFSESKKGLYIINTGANLGYAGGNNVGMKFSLCQKDVEFVWVLNNDTVVQNDSLKHLVSPFFDNEKIGIVGSKLVYFDTPTKLQGIGGTYNPWLSTVKHVAGGDDISMVFDDAKISKNIDYVIGASLLFTADFLKNVGLFSEDYFLYFEELDIVNRAKMSGYDIWVASKSIVFHKEGASIKRSPLSDFYFVRNRLIITRKFYPYKIFTVWLSLFLVAINRLKTKRIKEFYNVITILLGRRNY